MTLSFDDLSLAPLAVDAMGGDYGPSVVVDGAIKAAVESNVSSILVGDQNQIQACLDKRSWDKNLNNQFKEKSAKAKIEILHAEDVVSMSESPASAVRSKSQASINLAFELVKQGKASAVVSSGNTGAVMAAGLFSCGGMPGIQRPAIATFIPRIGNSKPVILLDSGANVDCNAMQLVQFALMGHHYFSCLHPEIKPRIALLSNGAELTKGTDVIRAAALRLAQLKEIDFIGYVEGRDLVKDKVDVVVCDGFLGNVVLKTIEGCAELVFDTIRSDLEASARGKLGIWLTKPLLLSSFKQKLDPSAYGGAPLLGLNALAIVCHGASNQTAIANALKIAASFVKTNLVSSMRNALHDLDLAAQSNYNDGFLGGLGVGVAKSDQKK